ncbi:MAG: hypothetical protein KDD53_06795, partial [Bdellovibrionales bacterium]|nr:hypothetical protein [Bdellovibrionales bacterium]
TRYLTSTSVFDTDGNANEVEIAVDFVTHAGRGAKIPKLPSGSLPFAIVEAEFLQDRTLSRALAEQFRRGNHTFDLLKDRSVEIHPTDRIIGDHITMRYLSTHGADEVVRHESSLLEELIKRRVGQLAPHIPSVVALDGVILTENIAKDEADLHSWVEHTDIKKERVRRTLLNSSAIAEALSYAKKNRDLCSQLPDGKSIGFIPKAVWIEVVAHQRNKSRLLVIEGMPDHSGETPHVEVNLTTKQYNELALLRRSGSIRFTRYTFSGPVTSDGKAIGEAKIEVHALTHAGSSGRDGKIPDDSSTFLPVQIQLDDKALATDILNGSSQLPKLAQAVIFPPLGRDLGKTLRSDRVARRGVTSRTLKEVDLIRYASAN